MTNILKKIKNKIIVQIEVEVAESIAQRGSLNDWSLPTRKNQPQIKSDAEVKW